MGRTLAWSARELCDRVVKQILSGRYESGQMAWEEEYLILLATRDASEHKTREIYRHCMGLKYLYAFLIMFRFEACGKITIQCCGIIRANSTGL